jgi:hypothetical protein
LTAREALDELALELHSGPVIASVYRDFDPAIGGGHLVVVTEVSESAVSLNDPWPAHETEGRRVLALDYFLPAFKHRFIVVRP